MMNEVTTLDDDVNPLPDGEYAMIEMMGHRTLVGRVSEIEKFGATMMQIEPVFGRALLPGVLTTGASIYQYTPITRDRAWQNRATRDYQLPSSIACLLPEEAPIQEFIFDAQLESVSETHPAERGSDANKGRFGGDMDGFILDGTDTSIYADTWRAASDGVEEFHEGRLNADNGAD